MAKVNPLSNPKGVKLLCELCQKPAFIQCTKCTVAYYYDSDHQRMDWVGIHEQICQLLLPVRTPLPFKSLCKEREHQQAQLLQRQKHLIELTQGAARKKLYGLSTLPLILPYLLLAEASIGTGHLLQAEEYLSQAQWTVLERSECSRSILHKLHRNLGLLYAAKGEFDNALHHLGNDIYYASEEFGTDSIVTSGGYFHMANVFFRQSKMDIADSLYTKKHLIELTQGAARKKLYGLSTLPLILPYLLLAEASIGTGHLLQAEEYLSQAQWTVLERSECSRSILHKLHRNLGLLYAAKGEFDNALHHLGNDIYYASEEFGTDSIVTSGGYFNMAKVFVRQSKMDVADSLYTKVSDGNGNATRC
ncbi:UNVERIFIED_CONTAM: hypothetical protein FKN15_033262 [Acipenser sinensis]